MAKIKTITGLRTIDTRTCPPPPKRADAELGTSEYRQWAEEVKRRAGYRCEAVDNGKRCEVKAPSRLFSDHIAERRDGGKNDPDNGMCLCGSHHTRKTVAVRAGRMAERI